MSNPLYVGVHGVTEITPTTDTSYSSM